MPRSSRRGGRSSSVVLSELECSFDDSGPPNAHPRASADVPTHERPVIGGPDVTLILVASAVAASAALVAWAARAEEPRQIDNEDSIFDEAAAD
jgi:hypothetical protein